MPTASLTCVRCDEAKPADQFVNDRTRNSGKFPWCKPCVMESRAETKLMDSARQRIPAKPGERACPGCLTSVEGMHANRRFCSTSCKNKVRNWQTFGLSPDEYRALVASNEGLCPICKREPKRWVIDHNHKTGEVTGVVCSVCNQSLIAYSRHEVATARRLLDYLTNPPLPGVIGEHRIVGPQGMSQRERQKGWRRARGPYSVGMAQTQDRAENLRRAA